MQRWLMMLCWAMASLMMGTLSAKADDLDMIRQRGTLRVAIPQDYPPFGTIAPDLTPEGYDIDTARYLAQGLGVALELVPVTSANRVAYLVSGRADLVISSLGKTPERARTIAFSTPYAPFYYGVFSSHDEPMWQDASPLSGRTVGATRGSLEELQLTAIAPPDTHIKRYEDNVTTLSAFTSGQVDYIATGTPVAASLAKRGGDRLPHPVLLLKNSPCSVGLPQDAPQLRDAVNALIDAGLRDGTFDALSRHWFGVDLPVDMRPSSPASVNGNVPGISVHQGSLS